MEDADKECLVITGETTNNGREYVSSGGYIYKLTDDEIHDVLDDIDTSVQ